jgi:hypothetical protein
MDASQLIRVLTGGLQAAEVKSARLIPGQTVRGVVVQLLEQQDALVKLGGVLARARLEVPLPEGASVLLQVQGESERGELLLKPVRSFPRPPVQAASGPNEPVLGGMNDHRRLLEMLRESRMPLTQETLRALAALAAAPEAGSDPEGWHAAMLLVLQRRLPLTESAVGAIRAALRGGPLAAIAGRLAGQLLAAQADAGLPEAARIPLQRALSAARAVLAGAGHLVRAASVSPPAAAPAGLLPEAGAYAAAAGSAPPGRPAGKTADRAALPADAALSAGPGPAAVRGGGREARAARQMFAAGEHLPQGKALSADGRGGAQSPATGAVAASEPGAASAARAASFPRPGEDGAGTASSPGEALVRLLRALGLGYERDVLRLAGDPPGTDGTPDAASAGEKPEGTGDGRPATLKSALLELVRTEGLPAELKDTARQLVQQITGQQLLMTGDRADGFSLVSLIVPLGSEPDSGNAAIHIQSRKGRRGTMDSANCRLLFDLRMEALGPTLIDVRIVDRTISLQVRNNHPRLRQVFDSGRKELAAVLQGLGYPYFTVQYGPYPKNTGDAGEPGRKSALNAGLLLNAAKPYEGMDIRI